MHSQKFKKNVNKVQGLEEHVSKENGKNLLKILWVVSTNFCHVLVSVISRALIIYLIYKETMYYMDSKLVFKFKPDTDMDTKLKIHIDITVATPCSSN